jgi:hypothetical protein
MNEGMNEKIEMYRTTTEHIGNTQKIHKVKIFSHLHHQDVKLDPSEKKV